MKRKKQLFTLIVSMMLIAMMVVQPFTSIRSYAADTVKLTSLKYTNAKNSMGSTNYKKYARDGFTAKTGKEYEDNILFFDAGAGDSQVTYILDGKYKTYNCRCIVGEKTGEGQYSIRFYDEDGEELNDYVGHLNRNEKYYEDLVLNVKGVQKLTIKAKVVEDTSKAYGFVYIVNNILTVDPNKKDSDSGSSSSSSTDTNKDTFPDYSDADAAKGISSIKTVAKRDVVLKSAITTPKNKKYKTNTIKMDASEKAYVTYNINKKYEKVTGKIVGVKGSGNGNFTIKFYGDGKLLKTYKNIKRSDTKSFSVSTKNVKKLKITSSNNGEYDYGYVGLVDVKLAGGNLKLSSSSLILGIDDVKTITAKYKNKKIANNKLSWSTSNPNVVYVSKGKILANSGGAAVVKATYKNETRAVVVYVKPGKIQDFHQNGLTSTTASLTWKAQKNISGYMLYTYNEKLKEYIPAAYDKDGKPLKISKETIMLQNLTPNTSYNYAICGFVTVDGKDYVGQLSDPLTFTTFKQ
jgi:hypothetical protein